MSEIGVVGDGPYARIVGADGARSTMRRFLPFRARIHEHRWGALWGVFPDPAGTFDGRLDQYFDGARRMAGFLPTGSSAVSLFWSAVRRAQARFYGFGARALNAVFQNDLDAFAWPRDRLMGPVSRLPWVRRRALEVLSGVATGPFGRIRT